MIAEPLVETSFLETQRRAGLFEAQTLWDLAQRVPADRTAVVCARNGRIDYATLITEAEGLAGAWERAGIGSGDVVMMQLPNWYEFVLAHLALTRLGAITLPLLPIYRERELTFIARASNAVAVLAAPTFRATPAADFYDALVAEVPTLQRWIAVDGVPSLREIAQAGPAPTTPPPTPDEVTLIMATSGTTGDPKLILHSHRSTVGGVIQRISRDMGLAEGDAMLMPSPIGHATGLQYGVRLAIAIGATVILQEQWSPDEAATLVKENGAVWIMGATPFLHDLVHLPEDRHESLSTLRMFVCGGAPVPAQLARRAVEVLPHVNLLAAWGMSETGVVTMVRPGDPIEKVAGTDGRVVEGWEVRIADEEGRVVPDGEHGEIQCRGAALFLGYFGRDDLTTEAVPDGWLRTGDIGMIDGDGYMRCLGRIKDLIIRGGLNISATEIENLVRTHPDVHDAAVVGMPDPRLGERACAFIVAKGDRSPTLEELNEHLTALGLAKFKLPEKVVVTSELPMSPIGKVLKYVLRKQLADNP